VPFGRSIMPVFGGWVIWVYLLTLVVLSPPPRPKPPLRRTVEFLSAEKTYLAQPAAAGNALGDLHAELSEALDYDALIPVRAIPGTARPGSHFEIESDAAMSFPAGSTRGTVRVRNGKPDIRIGKSAEQSVRFTLRLDGTKDVVPAPDPRGYRDVEIPPADRSVPPASTLTRAWLDKSPIEVQERDFASYQFVVTAEKPAEKDAVLNLELRRGIGDHASVVKNFTMVMPKGKTQTAFRLAEQVPPEELVRLGLADDKIPGGDQVYELHLDARPPLIALEHSSPEKPYFTTAIVRDDDGQVDLRRLFESPRGDVLTRVNPNEPFFVRHILSAPLETNCHVESEIDGKRLSGVIRAGEKSCLLGPFTIGAEHETIGIRTATRTGPGCCHECGIADGTCPHCKPSTGSCKACRSQKGGCAACQYGRGACAGCGGRPGGCQACGFGSGTCGVCKGQGGGCGACGGRGKGGAGGGEGGGGGGSGGSGGGPVSGPGPQHVGVGPPVPGDFLLVLVNNQRLHEPGDKVAENVVKAIKDENAYKDAALVVNEHDDAALQAGGAPPDPEKAFKPFAKDRENIDGQVDRLVETIAQKRTNAANPNLRAVVVWPERELSSASSVEGLSKLVREAGGPISILCPDADPEKARRLATALNAEAGGGHVTVRSPKTAELVEHIKDVIHGGAPAGENDAPGEKL
jgi:hypothetical protein